MSMVKILTKLNNYFQGFEFGVYDANREKPASWRVEALTKNLKYLQAQNADKKHIFMRPVFDQEPFFMLVDDLDVRMLERHKVNGKWKGGRLIVATSPGNYQVWIHSSRGLGNEEKLYWLKRMNSDPGAAPKHRWGRSPGFRNHKYADSPLARLIWIDWTGPVDIPLPDHLQGGASIKPASRPQSKPSPVYPGNGNGDPADLISRADFDVGDESTTDFRFVLSLIRRGAIDDVIKTRLLAERTNWQNHRGSEQAYIARTLKKAHEVAAK